MVLAGWVQGCGSTGSPGTLGGVRLIGVLGPGPIRQAQGRLDAGMTGRGRSELRAIVLGYCGRRPSRGRGARGGGWVLGIGLRGLLRWCALLGSGRQLAVGRSDVAGLRGGKRWLGTLIREFGSSRCNEPREH